MAELTIDDAIMTEILSRNLDLVMHALADAVSYREDLEDEDSAEAYAALAAELARIAAIRAAQDVARMRWKQAVAEEAAARRNRRGRRPVPQITGIRIPPPEEHHA